ncbi:HPP family protein [Hydrogenovibrio kuenenii]|uniref:HPP family protein n=1 Tax=Hydrogenovibrio kuenenii TaxID=63658 RepID=UPI0004656252|nr:HPP family protein [Hydrogenovibrio kuenenii]
MKNLFNILSDFAGWEQQPVSHHEKFISAIGGFISILAITIISRYFLGQDAFWLLIPSMGASAVLLFAVPHGPLSQPWPLIGGNLISAIIGVTSALLISDQVIAIASAVGLSILGMYYFKCIHPPGGATAMITVLATKSVHSLGYSFIMTPVLLNTLSIFIIAMLFNSFFKWRRYPAFLNQKRNVELDYQEHFFNHEDFINALKKIDSFVDINEYDLKRIFALINLSANLSRMNKNEIKLGSYYSNGEPGSEWAVRQVIDEDVKKELIIFKEITGKDKTASECLTKTQFANWAKYEISKENGQWERKPSITK